MGRLGDGSHRGQGCQAWTAVGMPPRYSCRHIYIHYHHVPHYQPNSIQTISRSSSWPGLRSSDTGVYAKPRCRTKFGERVRLLLCWTYCMEQSSTPSPSNQWHWSFQVPPQNWTISYSIHRQLLLALLVEWWSVNSAIQMTLLLLVLLPLVVKIPRVTN